MLGITDTRTSIARPLTRHLEASVLRHAPFGDIQFGQHLDAREHLLGQLAARDGAHRDSTPSMRYLKLTPRASVSMWMSLAAAFKAS